MSGSIFFSGWEPILRTAVIAILAYPAMLLMVRISGHRTLAQLNAFDLIVTVALGSTLASVITTRDVALAQGLLAFLLLILMQYALAWSARSSSKLERYLNGEPVLLFCRGSLLSKAMNRARITEEEIKSALRSEGKASLDDVEAVILETNGNLSVVAKSEKNQLWAIKNIVE
jgi:uncharacterized membrane protein YcaP (DUF421 family)